MANGIRFNRIDDAIATTIYRNTNASLADMIFRGLEEVGAGAIQGGEV